MPGLTCPGIQIDTFGRRVIVNGSAVPLTTRQFDLLAFFMRHPGKVLSRHRLLESVWGHEFLGTRAVDVQVTHLRTTLRKHGIPNPIRTVTGVGYGFELPE